MPTINLTHTIDAAHRLANYEGKCARIHGHTYKIEVEAYAESLQGAGFVADFGEIKKILDEWDHRLLLWEGDTALINLFSFPIDFDALGILLLPFNPTAENMAEYLAKRLATNLDLLCCRVKVWETPKAYALGNFGFQDLHHG